MRALVSSLSESDGMVGQLIFQSLTQIFFWKKRQVFDTRFPLPEISCLFQRLYLPTDLRNPVSNRPKIQIGTKVQREESLHSQIFFYQKVQTVHQTKTVP